MSFKEKFYDQVAAIVQRGHDVEIRKDANGKLVVFDVSKKRVKALDK